VFRCEIEDLNSVPGHERIVVDEDRFCSTTGCRLEYGNELARSSHRKAQELDTEP
jgi:hypothetical protein